MKTPTQHDDVTPAELVDAVALLGPARMVLDRCAEGRPGCAAEAADMAQRIVDLIGHGVTDEPPHALVQNERMRTALVTARDFIAHHPAVRGDWPLVLGVIDKALED